LIKFSILKIEDSKSSGVTRISEEKFEECYKMASIATIKNISIPFLHLNQLIEEKKIVGREKDKSDVVVLEKIQRRGNS
jgi:hypothetical protein